MSESMQLFDSEECYGFENYSVNRKLGLTIVFP